MRLIELDAALDALRETIVPAEDVGFGDESTDGYNDGINMSITVLSGLPAVVPVPMVRCGFCKYYASVGYCALHQTEMCETDFCSYGKKDGDNG